MAAVLASCECDRSPPHKLGEPPAGEKKEPGLEFLDMPIAPEVRIGTIPVDEHRRAPQAVRQERENRMAEEGRKACSTWPKKRRKIRNGLREMLPLWIPAKSTPMTPFTNKGTLLPAFPLDGPAAE